MKKRPNFNERKLKFKKESMVKEYKNKMDRINDKQEDFANEIIDKIFNCEKDKIYVNYNRCGIGKTTLIKSILNNLVNNYFYFGLPKDSKMLESNGVIVVTDKLDRLEDINNYKGLEDICYFMKYEKSDEEQLYKNTRIEFNKQLEQQKKYPIVLISTQKYFKMKEKERNLLYEWEKGKRSIKLIDEKPYIITTDIINEKYLSDISKGLEELPKGEEKEYLIDYWEQIRNHLYNLRKNYTEYDLNWISGDGTDVLFSKALDKKFFEILEKYATTKIYNDIECLKDINKNGCLFVSPSDSIQSNARQLILIRNNIDKFDIDKCKNIIFDATAKYDIEYNMSDRFELFKSNDTKESDIKIHHILTSTSQNSLLKKENHIETISKYINSLGDNLFVATYGKKRGIFQEFSRKLNTKNIAYFGDIKGKNDWNAFSSMAQIGMNRKSNYVYLIKYIALTNIDKKWNKIIDQDEISLEIKNIIENKEGIFENDKMQEIMESDLIVDTIQNIMRIKCRHFSNTELCNIFILCASYLNNITRKVADVVNAKLEEHTPNIFKEEKLINRKANEGKEKTNPQILLEYLKNLDKGKIIKMKDLIKGSGLTKKQIDKVREKHCIIKEWFEFHKTKKKGEYIA
ncbi:hypothetical protein ACFO6R_06430 [Eubacterium multiforme]|uniref:Uncharacterized protein n=1 Tax=Eubacterium multiforme TaxID=83339 RepID=A0ABT9USE7_9FIRM|nr:hypothetical protein [Eubacterium multiforme]MDQ0149230.1 hypothetical protein [Eubacterium multiforme]